ELRLVHNLHEQASAIACEAYAKVTDGLGAAFVTTGPGGINAVTGVAGAWLDSTPTVFVSGQVKRADLKGKTGVRSGGAQEVGNGVRLGRGQREMRKVIGQLGIPVLLTLLGIDLLTDDHPLYAGRPGAVAPRGANFAVQNSDFLLSVGARLDRVLTGYSHENFARAARKVVVDIDPAELKKLHAM